MRYIIITLLTVNFLFSSSVIPIINKIDKLKAQEKSHPFKKIEVKYDPFFTGVKIMKKIKKTVVKKSIQKRSTHMLKLIAVLNDKAFIDNKWYGKGDAVEGYRVIKIDSDKVAIKKGKKMVILHLNNKKILSIKKEKGEDK